MKYAIMTYDENKKFFNIGDYIQSLAAKQYLPKIDTYINREELASYKGEKVKLILNGWFTHNTQNWIPSENIEPLFISFHINNTAAQAMLTSKAIEYLKKYQPIGCRDEYTVGILKDKGIEAYFSGCLTTTLDSYKVDDKERGKDTYIVDPLYSYPRKEKVFYNLKWTIKSLLNGDTFQLNKKRKHLKNIFDEEILNNAIYINQEPQSNKYNDLEKFEMAEDLLHKYARAKLVITSRIHCALPCLALGTPVIFINGFDSFVDTSRFDGIINLFNRVDVNSKTGEFKANFSLKGKITSNINIKNLELHHKIADPMKKTCKDFI
ncbi:polysaccharide pyruvyl transferase family protein [Arcobacter roscoffensis]|uniref:Polysaccharide pyruvyl transferase family protein n=1 Tax=Arcobacter roscoffensis TaxID=2961520 RepID=A0ABY5E242_9BACT|nr:polysaccharide pyruvyl transferase family protein [Arcobacter roscoffensis]UTJ05790.1 polysaccharide pyruvyl transferase family protein [Arcobacter roscoffensis]